jgi:hypothetical protein
MYALGLAEAGLGRERVGLDGDCGRMILHMFSEQRNTVNDIRGGRRWKWVGRLGRGSASGGRTPERIRVGW